MHMILPIVHICLSRKMYRRVHRSLDTYTKATTATNSLVCNQPKSGMYSTLQHASPQNRVLKVGSMEQELWTKSLSKPWSFSLDLSSTHPRFVRSFHQMFYHVDSKNSLLEDVFKGLMSKVPQPVVVVTSAFGKDKSSEMHDHSKRGVTCSSFTGISLDPAIVSFAVTTASRMHDMLKETQQFIIHVLDKDQVNLAVHFAKPAISGIDQFERIPHEVGGDGIPILRNACAVLHCRTHAVTTIGDHHVWYGEVQHAYQNGHGKEPLLYYSRSFRSIGDEAFMQAFENTSLPFQDWTHEAHIRMSWNYITEYGMKKAAPLIIKGIHRYNEQHKDKVSRGYHETITQFYIYIIADAIEKTKDKDESFEAFLTQNDKLIDPHLPFNYYSDQVINSKEAKHTFIQPDLQPLP